MAHLQAQPGFELVSAFVDFGLHGDIVELGQPRVSQRVRPDGRKGILGQAKDLVPTETLLPNKGRPIDPGLGAKLVQNRAKLLLRTLAQARIDGLERRLLLPIGAGGQRQCFGSDHDPDGFGAAQRFFELHPPQSCRSVREPRGDIHRKGSRMPFEHRQGVFDVVSVSIVECQHRERGTLRRRSANACDRLVQRHYVIAKSAQSDHDRFEEFRRNLQESIRAEGLSAGGPHMMEHQDRAEPAQPGRDQPMESGRSQQRKTRADDFLLQGPSPVREC